MSKLNPTKKNEPKKIQRTHFTDMEMQSFDSKLNPFLVDGKLDKDTINRFMKANKICKFTDRVSPISGNKYVEMSLYADKVELFFEMELKFSQWSYWKRGLSYTKSLEEMAEGSTAQLSFDR